MKDLPKELQEEVFNAFQAFDSTVDGDIETVHLNGIEYAIIPISYFDKIKDVLPKVIQKAYEFGKKELPQKEI